MRDLGSTTMHVLLFLCSKESSSEADEMKRVGPQSVSIKFLMSFLEALPDDSLTTRQVGQQDDSLTTCQVGQHAGGGVIVRKGQGQGGGRHQQEEPGSGGR